MISYLHNNLVTPYSYSCAEKLRATCKAEGCENPANAEEALRCQGRYVSVLNTCVSELDGAAVMAKCKDSQVWAVRAVGADEMKGTRVASVTHAKQPASRSDTESGTTPTSSVTATTPETTTTPNTAPPVTAAPAAAASDAAAPVSRAPLVTPPLEFYGPPSAAAPAPLVKPSPAAASALPTASMSHTPSGSVEVVSRTPGNRRKSDRIRVRRVRPKT